MVVVVFRARRTPEGEGDEHKTWFARMSELARKMSGYISHKGYVAEDASACHCFNGSRQRLCPRGRRIRNTSRSSSWAARSSIRNIICRSPRSCGESKFARHAKPD